MVRSMTSNAPAEWAELPPLRWGLIGAGGIARSLTLSLAAVPGDVVAVCARNPERTAAFAEEHGIPTALTDLGEMLADDSIDIVYVATPHSVHEEPVVAALEAGTAVLCEKPLSHGLTSTLRCIDAARASSSTFMEAMWTRFLPAWRTAESWIEAGDIGEVRTLTASMGFPAPTDPTHRLMDPALAGGALLDIGVYVLALTQRILGGDPEDVQVLWEPTATGVDGQTSIGMRWADGRMANLSLSLVSDMEGTAVVSGTEGAVAVPSFHRGEEVQLTRRREVIRTERFPHLVNGLEHQVAAITAAVADGAQEVAGMTWADSIEVAALSQRIRDRMGLRYPFDPPT